MMLPPLMRLEIRLRNLLLEWPIGRLKIHRHQQADHQLLRQHHRYRQPEEQRVEILESEALEV